MVPKCLGSEVSKGAVMEVHPRNPNPNRNRNRNPTLTLTRG